MNDIITIQRVSHADTPNVNGITYSKDTITKAFDEALKNNLPVHLAPISTDQYIETCNNLDYSKYPVGYLYGYDEDTMSVLINKNLDIVNDYVIPNIGKLRGLLVYSAELDKETKNVISDIHIKRIDISILPETYFD